MNVANIVTGLRFPFSAALPFCPVRSAAFWSFYLAAGLTDALDGFIARKTGTADARGELLTGGICIKEYLSLKKYGQRPNEYRIFVINHEVASVSRNSGQGDYTPLPPRDLIEKYRFLDSPYYTIDAAELDDGSWKILEAGDGSVSGLSNHQDYEQYFRALYHCFL